MCYLLAILTGVTVYASVCVLVKLGIIPRSCLDNKEHVHGDE